MSLVTGAPWPGRSTAHRTGVGGRATTAGVDQEAVHRPEPSPSAAPNSGTLPDADKPPLNTCITGTACQPSSNSSCHKHRLVAQYPILRLIGRPTCDSSGVTGSSLLSSSSSTGVASPLRAPKSNSSLSSTLVRWCRLAPRRSQASLPRCTKGMASVMVSYSKSWRRHNAHCPNWPFPNRPAIASCESSRASNITTIPYIDR